MLKTWRWSVFLGVVVACVWFHRGRVVAADPPFWWVSQGVMNTNRSSADFAMANQGQAKWFSERAMDNFAALPGGAGAGISNLVASFSSTNDFLPLNLGQLKTLADPFYARLIVVGWTNAFPAGMWGTRPWTASAADDADFAAVNLGQLKYVFSFDTEAVLDSDSDSLVDRIERWMGLALDDSDTDNDGTLDGDEDADNDGLSNAYEANTARTDPTNSDTNAPSVTILTPTNGLVKVWVP